MWRACERYEARDMKKGRKEKRQCDCIFSRNNYLEGGTYVDANDKDNNADISIYVPV